jgi:hypothetical protein
MLSRWRSSALVTFILVGGALAPGAAVADPSHEDQAAAQVLFDQGKDLMKNGKLAEACSKFEESQRLDPRIATQFKLADCLEKVGRTASAWANFMDVVTATRAAKQPDREKVARDRAAALEKSLSRLTIVMKGSAPDVRVVRDGKEIGPGLLGTAIPVDPGAHRISASAPGKKTWQTEVEVKAGGATATVTIPDLENEPVPETPPTATAPSSGPASPVTAPIGPTAPPVAPDAGRSGSGQRIAGAALGAVGLAGVGVGIGFGLIAKGKLDDSAPYCKKDRSLCTQQGLDLTNQARANADVSTGAFIAGGALVAAGVIVFFTAPSKPEPKSGWQLVPLVSPQVAGAGAVGVW